MRRPTQHFVRSAHLLEGSTVPTLGTSLSCLNDFDIESSRSVVTSAKKKTARILVRTSGLGEGFETTETENPARLYHLE